MFIQPIFRQISCSLFDTTLDGWKNTIFRLLHRTLALFDSSYILPRINSKREAYPQGDGQFLKQFLESLERRSKERNWRLFQDKHKDSQEATDRVVSSQATSEHHYEDRFPPNCLSFQFSITQIETGIRYPVQKG